MPQQGQVYFICYAEIFIQPFQKNLQHIDLRAGEVLIGTEKIPQEGDMP